MKPTKNPTVRRVFHFNYAAALILLTKCAYAYEFNTEVLSVEDKSNIDLSRFSRDQDYVFPGEYYVDVYVNSHPLSERKNILFYEDNVHVVPCISLGLVSSFGLKPSALDNLVYRQDNQCLDLSVVENLSVSYDVSRQRLNVSVAQAWMEVVDREWVPPSQWDDGISGLVLDYSLFYNYYDDIANDNSRTSLNAYGVAGVNLGPWRLRGLYSYSRYDSSQSQFNWSDVYAFRAIPSLNSKLTVGKTYLSSQIFDAVSFKGINLATDERMMPPSLQGYAPQVSGVARTRALVTLSQNSRVIRQESVSPGPFLIDNIPNTMRGLIDVRVEEEDGSVHSYQVSTASVPFLSRRGRFRYNAALGKTDIHTDFDVNFASAEGSYGIYNDTSVYGGVIVSNSSYTSMSVGVGQNLQAFGGVSFDVTHSRANPGFGQTFTGNSYRVNYSKNFESTRTQINFAGYRYSDRNFMSLSRFVGYRSGDVNSLHNRQTYALNFNQYVPTIDLTLYASLTKQTYWAAESSKSISLSAAKNLTIGPFKNVITTLSLSQTKTIHEKTNNQISFFMNFPLEKNRSVKYDFYNDRSTKAKHTLSYNAQLDSKRFVSVSAGGEYRDLPKEALLRANYSHYFPAGDLTLSASHQPKSYSNYSVDWSGSMTATRRGFALHQRSSGNEPRLMVKADDLQGVPFIDGAKTNRFGVAVLNGVQSYRPSNVYLDLNKLPEDMEAKDTVLTHTLTEGAIGYRKIQVRRGLQMIASISLENGDAPPLAAAIYDQETGSEIALVGDKGLSYLFGIQANSRLTLKYSGKSCEIVLPSEEDIRSDAHHNLICVSTR